jgi:hypothetical protein
LIFVSVSEHDDDVLAALQHSDIIRQLLEMQQLHMMMGISHTRFIVRASDNSGACVPCRDAHLKTKLAKCVTDTFS